MATETRAEETESNSAPESKAQVVGSKEEGAGSSQAEAEDVSLDELLLEGEDALDDDPTVTDAHVDPEGVDAALEQERHAAAAAEEADRQALLAVTETPEAAAEASDSDVSDDASSESDSAELSGWESSDSEAAGVTEEVATPEPTDAGDEESSAVHTSVDVLGALDSIEAEEGSTSGLESSPVEPDTMRKPPLVDEKLVDEQLVDEQEHESAEEREEMSPVLTDAALQAVLEAEGLSSEGEELTSADAGETISGPSIAARRGDTVPLPSFQMTSPPPKPASQPSPSQPPSALPEMSLAAMQEDEDDAVTHIGLALPEAADPGYDTGGYASPAEYVPPSAPPAPEFRQSSRSAETVVVPRVEAPLAAASPSHNKVSTSPRRGGAALGWVTQLFKKPSRMPAFEVEDDASRKQLITWVVSSALAGLGAGAVIMALYRPSPARPAQATAALQPSVAAAQEMTPLQRAEAGDKSAMEKLAGRAPAERKSSETLALAQGEQVQREQEFANLLSELRANSGDAVARVEAGKRLAQYANDSSTRFAALSAISEWPGSDGPDLIYSIWSKAPGGSPTATLAFDLLSASDIRAKSSAALQAALDLRAARSCEDYRDVLPRVVQHGDRRALLSLKPLAHDDGCGDDGSEDCYPCLRDDDLLQRALEAAKGRPEPFK